MKNTTSQADAAAVAAKESANAHQMAMAKNIARLRTRGAQKQQAHLLCQSLKRSVLAGGA